MPYEIVNDAPSSSYELVDQPPANWKDRVQAHQAGVWNATAHLVGAIPDAAYQLYSLGKAAVGAKYHYATGADIPSWLQVNSSTLTPTGDALARTLDKFHDVTPTTLDRPDDVASRYAANVSQVLPGIAVGGGSARNFARGLIPAAGGATAASVVRENKGDQSDATNNGLAIGSDLLAQALIRGGGNVASSLVNPWTAGGRSKLVGRALESEATNPDQALGNLRTSPEYVPGSMPTTGVASKDQGLLSLEAGIANDAENRAAFAARKQSNNQARQNYLTNVARTESDLQRAIDARDQEADANYGRAWAEGRTPPDQVGLGPAVGKPQPGIDLGELGNRPAVRRALGSADTLIENSGRIPGENAVMRLHFAKLALDDEIEQATRAGNGNQARSLISARNALVSKIEEVAPGYKNAREAFRNASGPINQMEILQGLQKKAANAVPDVSGTDILNQGKWRSAVSRAADSGDLDKLTEDQRQIVDNITADLNRESSANSANQRVAGSNTAFNLSSRQMLANILGRRFGESAIGKTAGRAIDWAYRSPDELMREQLANSLLYPKQAVSLLDLARRTRPMDSNSVLLQYGLPAAAIGAQSQ